MSLQRQAPHFHILLHSEKSGEQRGIKGLYLDQKGGGTKKGRESDDERILAYNIGISIQDIYFSNCSCVLQAAIIAGFNS